MHDGDLEHCLIEEKNRCSYDFHHIYILAFQILGILKMQIHVCFRDVSQPAVYYFIPGIMRLSVSLYRKCTVFTVSLCSLQVLAMYKKVLS